MKPRRKVPAKCDVDGARLTHKNVPNWPEFAEGDLIGAFTYCYGCGGRFCYEHDAIPLGMSSHTRADHARYPASVESA